MRDAATHQWTANFSSQPYPVDGVWKLGRERGVEGGNLAGPRRAGEETRYRVRKQILCRKRGEGDFWRGHPRSECVWRVGEPRCASERELVSLEKSRATAALGVGVRVVSLCTRYLDLGGIRVQSSVVRPPIQRAGSHRRAAMQLPPSPRSHGPFALHPLSRASTDRQFEPKAQRSVASGTSRRSAQRREVTPDGDLATGRVDPGTEAGGLRRAWRHMRVDRLGAKPSRHGRPRPTLVRESDGCAGGSMCRPDRGPRLDRGSRAPIDCGMPR